MPVDSFDFDKPEFIPPGLTPKTVGKDPGPGGGAEAYTDEDIPREAAGRTSIGTVERPAAAPKPYVIPKVGGVVMPLLANPTGRMEARSGNVQIPPPLARPGEKVAAANPGPPPDELSAIASSLPTVDLSSLPAEEVPQEKAAAQPKQNVFSSARSTPSQLDQALIDKYGIEWLSWTPETLFQTVRADFGQIAKVNQDKMQAAALLHVSDSFWQHWEVFEKVTCAFNNVQPYFDRVQDVTVAQMLWAVTQAGEIRREPYYPEVVSYISVRAREDGFLYLPPPLDFAQDRLDVFNPPEAKLIRKEVRDRWEAFHGTDLRGVELQEDVYGIQLAKLAACQLYLEASAEDE